MRAWWTKSKYQTAEEHGEDWWSEKWLSWFTPTTYMHKDYLAWKRPSYDPTNWECGKLLSLIEFGIMLTRLHHLDDQPTDPDFVYERAIKRTIYCPRLSRKKQYRGYRGFWHPDAHLIGKQGQDRAAIVQAYCEKYTVSEETNPRLRGRTVTLTRPETLVRLSEASRTT